jgi:hypothetical protein
MHTHKMLWLASSNKKKVGWLGLALASYCNSPHTRAHTREMWLTWANKKKWLASTNKKKVG